jgi:hypothetical protein
MARSCSSRLALIVAVLSWRGGLQGLLARRPRRGPAGPKGGTAAQASPGRAARPTRESCAAPSQRNLRATSGGKARLGAPRAPLSREQRRPVSLVIDELPRFVRGGGASLTDILARARGHGLGLVGAVQHIGQVRPDLRAALLSEARNKVVLQPAADDAAMFARHLPGVTADDLMGLEPRTAIAALVAGGRVTSPVTIATLPPPEPTGYGRAARESSRARYGRDRAEVEREIAARRQGSGPCPRRSRRIEP